MVAADPEVLLQAGKESWAVQPEQLCACLQRALLPRAQLQSQLGNSASGFQFPKW